MWEDEGERERTIHWYFNHFREQDMPTPQTKLN